MSPRYIVDASVAIKWMIEEEGSAGAQALQGYPLAAPALMRVETANVLRRLTMRGFLSPDQARGLYEALLACPVTIVDADAALERAALALALELDHPVYDCLYLALARRLGCPMITADQRFLRRLGQSAYRGEAMGLSDAPHP